MGNAASSVQGNRSGPGATRLERLSGAELSVLRLFRAGIPMTRAEAARALGQSHPGVASHVERLVETGWLTRCGTRASGAGRPAEVYRLNGRAACGVGIEIRPESVRRFVAAVDGRVLLDSVRPSRPREASSLNALIQREASAAISEARFFAPVAGVGVALPGLVDCSRNVLIRAPNLGLSEVYLDGLASRLGVPVVLDNEANLAAAAEQFAPRYQEISAGESAAHGAPAMDSGTGGLAGAGQAVTRTGGTGTASSAPGGTGDSLVLVSVTEGVGAGLVLDARLVRGDTWRAGEVGHMAIREGRRRCSCGRRGCWEQYVSERALWYDARRRGVYVANMETLLSMIARGDQVAWAVWESYLYNFTVGIENIVACFDPRRIVVGGRIAWLGNLLVEPLQRMVDEAGFPAQRVWIEASGLREIGPAHGAALAPFAPLYPEVSV